MTVINREIVINAPRETVWRYFEDPDLLAAWLMRNNFKPEKGAAFQFFAQPNADWDGVLECRLIEFDPPKKLAFTWNANDIAADTMVTIELTPANGGTHIRLVHANFGASPFDVAAIVERHDEGWADHLYVLASQIHEDVRGAQKQSGAIDWATFDLYVAINAAPETVLNKWSTINGMESFFVQMMQITGPHGEFRAPESLAKSGDRFVWRWHNGRRVTGEYLASDSENEVRFTFGESRISVAVQSYKNGSLLHLKQYDIPDTEDARMHIHVNCRAAWVYFLTVLKTLLEHGVDGRDKTRVTGASFSTYFDPASVSARN